MAISLSVARKLCTAAEFALVEQATAKALTKLSAGRLKQKVTRARTLRNKYRDLAKQQKGEARGKRRPRGARASQGAENTKKKAALFDEVLGRFEAQAAKVAKEEAAASQRALTSPGKVAKGAIMKPSIPPPAKQTAAALLTELEGRKTSRKKHHKASKRGRQQSRTARTSAQKIQGHVSSAGRRKQAKRDAR